MDVRLGRSGARWALAEMRALVTANCVAASLGPGLRRDDGEMDHRWGRAHMLPAWIPAWIPAFAGMTGDGIDEVKGSTG